MSYEFVAFLLGVQTVLLALGLILGYKFLEFIRGTFKDINGLIDDVREDEVLEK